MAQDDGKTSDELVLLGYRSAGKGKISNGRLDKRQCVSCALWFEQVTIFDGEQTCKKCCRAGVL